MMAVMLLPSEAGHFAILEGCKKWPSRRAPTWYTLGAISMDTGLESVETLFISVTTVPKNDSEA
jgi:hypothetical protein